MNAVIQAQNAYHGAKAPVRTERGTEYQIFAKVTSRLSKASSIGIDGFAELAKAISDNRKLWSILASDVSETANGLPAPLKAQIFYLAEFTEVHSRKVLAREASPNALIEVNTAIMRGLRTSQAVLS